MKNYSTSHLHTNCALFAFLLIGLLTSHGQGQTTTTAQERAATERGATPKDAAQYDDECQGNANCITDKLKSLKLSIPGRFARGLQYQYELTEQPGTVLIDFEREGETITRLARNPQSYLQKHTLSFKFAELFTDRLSMFKRGVNYRDGDAAVWEFLCGNKPLITCLNKGGSWWQRVLMGASLEFSLAERPLVKDQLFLPAAPFGKDYQPHGAFVLDPAKLFPNAGDWKRTFDDVQNIDKALALLGASDVLAERKPWKQPLAFLLPKVEFKILSQFEFIKYNGALVFPERAINTWKFSWDLTRLIPDTKSRLDVDAITESLDNLKSNLGRDEPKRYCILHLPAGDRKVEVKNGFSAASCQKLAKSFGADTYELSCESKKPDGSDVKDNGPRRDPSQSPAPPTPNVCNW